MEFFRPHILSIITYTPLVGAILILFIDKEKKDVIRWVANLVGLLGEYGQ